MADDISETSQQDNESSPSIISRVCNFAAKHKVFVNFVVMNVACMLAVHTQVKNRTTAEMIMIYNAVFLGCALLSQFVTRGYYAKDHHSSTRSRRTRGGRRSPSADFEEEDAEGAGNVELPLPEQINGMLGPEDEIPPDLDAIEDILHNPPNQFRDVPIQE